MVKKIEDQVSFKTKDGSETSKNQTPLDSFGLRLKKRIQKCGSFMAGMIMPTVSILIAWGLLAAAFLGKYVTSDDGTRVWVATGWFKSEAIGQFIGPCMKYLIPILIGYTAGNMIYKARGGMFAAFMTFSIIVGSDWIYSNMAGNWPIGDDIAKNIGAPNQIVGSMVVAPLTTYLYKKLESTYIDKVKSGYEMIVRNFSLALLAIAFGLAVYFSWGFIMYGVSYLMTEIITLFTKVPWAFPFMTIVSEPLRAVFLNNALNFGVMIPLGIAEVATEKGYSSFFMVGGNPGQGFGLLIAYMIWRKEQRSAAGGSSVIQLFGGIHEVHYVYILAEPIMVLSTIAGSFASLSIVALLGGGTIAPISPGSIISVISMSGTGYRIGINILAVIVGAAVSFGVASFIMIFKKHNAEANLTVNVTDEGIDFGDKIKNNFSWDKAKILMVSCDAGMGSSAMAATILKKWVEENKFDIEVKNCAVKDLTSDVDIVVTMKNFAAVAQDNAPNARIYPVKQFLGANVFDKLQKDLLENKRMK